MSAALVIVYACLAAVEVPTTATAFPHRPATHNMIVAASWPAENDPTLYQRFVDEYRATHSDSPTAFA